MADGQAYADGWNQHGADSQGYSDLVLDAEPIALRNSVSGMRCPCSLVSYPKTSWFVSSRTPSHGLDSSSLALSLPCHQGVLFTLLTITIIESNAEPGRNAMSKRTNARHLGNGKQNY
jgi:hypothetical protein